VDSRAVPNILFGRNSRLNSTFVFGRILMLKISRIRIISTAPSTLVVSAFSLKTLLSPQHNAHT